MTNFTSVRFLSAALIATGLAAGARVPGLLADTAPSQAAVQQEIQVMTVTTRGGDGVALPGGSTVTMPVEASGSGMIVGQVIDAGTGQPVADAIVSLGGSFRGGRGAGPMNVTMINGNVSVGGNSDRPTIPRVMTDSEGRFAFRSIPKGSFDLSAQKNGYLDGAYGRLRPSGAAQQVSVEDGERLTNVSVRLFRPAAISGVLVDDRGEPVIGAEVRAYRRSLVSGRTRLVSTNYTTRSDDRGMYRLSGLTPGDYVIAAPTVMASMPADFSFDGRMPMDLLSTMSTPGSQSLSLSFGAGGTQVPGEDRFVLQRTGAAAEADGRFMTYATVYHPSASSVSGAQAISVRSGEDRGGVDVTLALRPTANISGRLIGPNGPADTYALHLVPSDTGDMSTDPSVATTMTTPDGSFAFLGVPAGSYVIQTVRVPRNLGRMGVEAGGGGGGMVMFTAAMPAGAAPAAPPVEQDDAVLWTATPVSVAGTNITGLAITLNEGIKVSGRVEFQGAEQKPTADEMRRLVIIATAADGRSRANIPPARVDAEGRFTLPGLLPGRYLISATGTPQKWMFTNVMAGNVDVADVPLEVGSRDVGTLVVTFTDKMSSLTGTVRSAEGRPDDSAAVIVFPADHRAWQDYGVNPRRMRMVRTSDEGAFNLGELPVGDYHLIAISEEVADEWQDPRFLEILTREATAVSIGAGEKATRELTRRAVRPIGGSPAPANAPAPVQGPAIETPADASVPAGDDTDDRDRGPSVIDEAPQQARDARVDPSAPAAGGSATISGVVVLDGETPQPVRRARVALRAADQRVERAVMTDDQGRFQISGLPAGRYAVSASKPAHVTGYFKSRPGRGPGAPLAVTPGQNLAGVTLRIAPGGVVSGRIVDETGNPFPGVSVRLMQYRTVSGERQLMPAALASAGAPAGGGTAVTDDRGEYRIFGLASGEYIVSATAPMRGSVDMRQLSRDDIQRVVADLKQPPAKVPGGGAAPAPDPTPLGGRAVGYSPTFYPGTHTSAQAVPVNVTAGVESRSIDMGVRLVPTARITGTVVGPDGRPMAGAQLMVLQADQSLMLTGGLTSMVRSGNDGTFTTGPLGPGRYAISARTGGGNQITEVGGGGMFVSRMTTEAAAAAEATAAAPKPLWAQQDVDLGGQDLSGITLQMQEGMTISGRLSFPAGSIPAPQDLTHVRLSLMPMASGRMVMGGSSPRVDADGSFKIEGVIPGSYRLNATVPASGFSATSRWTLGSAISGDKDVLDTGLVIEPGRSITGLALNFTDQTSEIGGTLMDPAGQPVSDLTVLLFPTDRALWSPGSRRMRAPTQPGSDGVFKFASLPPGEYYLAAVTELEPNAWGDPAVMEQLAAAAIRLTVAQGEKKVQDIKLAGG